MRSLREVDRLAVYDGKNKKSGARKKAGRVVDVLFHPSEPRVVGFVVDRPDILLMIRRSDRYLALDRARIGDDSVLVSGRDAWGRDSAKRLGILWEKTVVWSGMPVRTESGTLLGQVRDARFAEEDGSLESLSLTEGLTVDTALGRRDVSAELVRGFQTDAVVVSDEVLSIATDGGAAAAAGRGAASVKVGAEKAAVVAKDAATVAAVYGKAAVKAAAKHDTTRRAFGFLKSISDKVVDAARLPEDDG